MARERAISEGQDQAQASRRRRNGMIFIGVVCVWIILDQLTKWWFEATLAGAASQDVIPGVLSFSLVHNTGGAWGIFGNSTLALGILAVVICAAILAYEFILAPTASVPMTVGLALVFAGGVGNMFDRFMHGFVVDFIQLRFVDFPVFNIADIGVTCGVVVVLVSLIAHRDEHAQGR